MRSPSLAAVSRDGQPAQRNGVLNGELQPPRATSGWGTAPAPATAPSLPPAPNGAALTHGSSGCDGLARKRAGVAGHAKAAASS